MNTPTLPFGTAIALAQRTLTTSLHEVLGSDGLADVEWFALNALGLRGSELPVDDLAALLATNGLDRPHVEALLDDLAGRGLVERTASDVRLTEDGRVRYAGVQKRIALRSAEVFGRFDAARVEDARALLQEIAELDDEQLERIRPVSLPS